MVVVYRGRYILVCRKWEMSRREETEESLFLILQKRRWKLILVSRFHQQSKQIIVQNLHKLISICEYTILILMFVKNILDDFELSIVHTLISG
jgi:hypothetical protein